MSSRAGLALIVLIGCAAQPVGRAGRNLVSLVPSVTEIVFALGAANQLGGNTTECDWPEAARRVYKVGDFVNPDIERILAVKPRLVFLALPAHAALAERLSELGIRWYASRPASLEAVFAEVESVGALLGYRSAAESLARTMRRDLAAVEPASDSPRVYIEISSAPLMTVGGATFINDVVRRAGGRNVFADALQEYPIVDPERLEGLDPEVILVMYPASTAADVSARVGWDRISAVRTGRVYDGLDEDLFFRPGPRVVDGVRVLANLLRTTPAASR